MVRHSLMKQSLLIILTLLTLVCFGTPTKVTRIIDGDTFETETGEKVRLIGINAPEITDIFGEEAKTHLSQIIEGQTVDLIADNTSNDRDRYNRLLRYVILNGVDVNKQMLLDGYAFAYLKYRFDKETEYRDAQLIATKNNTGIWGNEKKETVIKQQANKDSNFWSSLSTKTYLISGLVIILLIAGVYYYFKK
jgi:micrococcal nuclease